MLTQNERGLPETSIDTGGIDVLDDTYLYDRNGNVAEIIDGLPGALGDREMSYDDLDRLLSVEAGSAQGGDTVVQYDGHDNIRALDQGSRQYRHQYNGANRLGEIQDPLGTTLFTLSYDNRGNQTRRTINGLHDNYTFDKANRLTATSIRENGVPVVSSYLYDGLGRRVRETRGQATYSGYNQAGQLLHQRDLKPATDVDHTYIYLGGSLVAKRTIPVGGGTAVIEYQHTDALGSHIATTNDTGTAVSYNRQTAYGEPADGSWENGPGFTGHVVDGGSRLVYMQQRYYDPAIGRFLSADPMAVDTLGGLNFNRFKYGANNPFRFVDPDGRQDEEASEYDADEVNDKLSFGLRLISWLFPGTVGENIDGAADAVDDVHDEMKPYADRADATSSMDAFLEEQNGVSPPRTIENAEDREGRDGAVAEEAAEMIDEQRERRLEDVPRDFD